MTEIITTAHTCPSFQPQEPVNLLSSIDRNCGIGHRRLISSEDASKRTDSIISDWRADLERILQFSSRNVVVLIGIGHPLRGDDYVGSYVIKGVMKELGNIPRNVLIFDAEDNVESVIMKAAKTKPTHVIFIDSCELNAQPGEIRMVTIAETVYPFFTTHGIPLKLMSEQMFPESEAWILAVQPKQTEFGESMSSEVSEACISISKFISGSLQEAN